MNRIIVIDNCEECSFFGSEHYCYAQECLKLKRIIEKDPGENYHFPIPDDCPLKTTNREITE